VTSSGSEPVHSAVDVDRVVRAARGVATSLGFRPDDAAVVALATRELGTNLVR
jgi:anti-sigma regulatory factor (Ser/Thr protein kinase)